ncbi:hypothetical protein [Kitasatospora sp. NBC_00315]|uniref:hypothetical protein n=1 Tax=Kitasatospora sp. NBC_00315 TaxID=2975963 RepID=UPI00324EAC09
MDEPAEEPWGLRIERVEIKDIALPDRMKRSMSEQAEARRERSARVLATDGGYRASHLLRTGGPQPGPDPAERDRRVSKRWRYSLASISPRAKRSESSRSGEGPEVACQSGGRCQGKWPS